MQRPQTPTPALVSQYVQKFDDDFGLADKALAELFSAFPDNIELEHVLLKVTAVNALYFTSIWNVFPVAKHICQLNIDTKLTQGVPDLVKEIADTPGKDGKIRCNYSFATKYCSWHEPEKYPIYDSFVDQLLWEYQKGDKFSDFKRGELWGNYLKYKSAIEEFRTHYKLRDYTLKDLDKFLWLYGKDLAKPI
jgi:hypothetical protein